MRHARLLTFSVVLLVFAASICTAGAAPEKTSKFSGQVTFVLGDGVRVGGKFLPGGGDKSFEDELYDLRGGQQIKVTRGKVNFKVELGESVAYCETREQEGWVTVNPSKAVLLNFRGGKSHCLSHIASTNCVKIGKDTIVKLGSPKRSCPAPRAGRPVASSTAARKVTIFEVDVRKKSTVVKVRRGVATVSGIGGQRKAVVVGSNGKGRRLQQVVIPRNAAPLRPTTAVVPQADTETFQRLAETVRLTRDVQPPGKPGLFRPPRNPSKDRAATFMLLSPETGAVLSCALDNDDFRFCTGSITYPNLAVGTHTFRVRATDTAGNTGEIRSYTWRIDFTRPKVSIAGPPSPAASPDATFTFKANEAATFTCSLDGIGPAPCSSPRSYTGLSPGRHTFTVRARDRAGNIGAARSYSWTIQRPPPAPIAFESDRHGNFEIYVINPDGTGEARLTTNPAEDVDPAWSPDGTKIAFESTRDTLTQSEIYVMSADGSGQTRLTTNPAIDRDPKWSPFGNRIAFETNRDGNSEIYVMSADGMNETRLTSHPGRDSDPAWSPDGKKIIFESDRDGNLELYVMNASGSNQTRLTTHPAQETNPVWSPDGTRIAFETDRDGNHEIYVINADGTNPTRLTTNAARDSDPAWSPDGGRIAFASERDGNLEIYVMNADGSNPTRLTNSPGRDLVPNW